MDKDAKEVVHKCINTLKTFCKLIDKGKMGKREKKQRDKKKGTGKINEEGKQELKKEKANKCERGSARKSKERESMRDAKRQSKRTAHNLDTYLITRRAKVYIHHCMYI